MCGLMARFLSPVRASSRAGCIIYEKRTRASARARARVCVCVWRVKVCVCVCVCLRVCTYVREGNLNSETAKGDRRTTSVGLKPKSVKTEMHEPVWLHGWVGLQVDSRQHLVCDCPRLFPHGRTTCSVRATHLL